MNWQHDEEANRYIAASNAYIAAVVKFGQSWRWFLRIKNKDGSLSAYSFEGGDMQTTVESAKSACELMYRFYQLIAGE
ncbi:MAG: hypothetical protein KF726_21820 [Anaerolineae bacterium]|nr:hypothetical protein [Anaerolineae bacterium]